MKTIFFAFAALLSPLDIYARNVSNTTVLTSKGKERSSSFVDAKLIDSFLASDFKINYSGPYCWDNDGFADCLNSCPTPDYGATCDAEYAGVNAYWCCHEPLPGCYSNSADAKSHCSSGKVSKIDEYVYCCTMTSCCYSGDSSCEAGDVCCLSDCADPANCTYTEDGCSGTYGAKHNCNWDSSNDACIAGIQ